MAFAGAMSPRTGSPTPPGRRRPPVLDASKTALIPLRPLTIGEILDGAFLVVRRNARQMIGLPLVVAGGAALYLLLGVGLWFLLGNTTVAGIQIVLTVLMAMLGMFLLVQCLVWMTAILSRVSLQTVLGEGFAPATTEVSLRSSLPMFFPMLGLSLLQYVASMIIQTVLTILFYLVLLVSLLAGSALENGPGAVVTSLVTVIMFALTALAYGYISMTVPALAVESARAPAWIGKPLKPTGVITSFERSFKLIGRKNLIRTMLVFAGAMLVCLALITLLSLGALAVVALYASSFGVGVQSILNNPWVIGLVAAFSTIVALSGLLAFMASVQTLLYLDLRMRREGLDLALRFDCVPIPQPAAPPPMIMAPPLPPGGLR